MSSCGVTSVAASTSITTVDWVTVMTVCDDLAEHINADGRPDLIVGVLRGGMIPAVRIAHVLGLREVRALDVRHTERDEIDAAKTGVPVVRNLQSLGDLSGLSALLVDDIAGTGQTMRTCRALAEQAGARTIRAAALALNEANWPDEAGNPHDTFAYIGATFRGWVVFPWENQ